MWSEVVGGDRLGQRVRYEHGRNKLATPLRRQPKVTPISGAGSTESEHGKAQTEGRRGQAHVRSTRLRYGGCGLRAGRRPASKDAAVRATARHADRRGDAGACWWRGRQSWAVIFYPGGFWASSDAGKPPDWFWFLALSGTRFPLCRWLVLGGCFFNFTPPFFAPKATISF